MGLIGVQVANCIEKDFSLFLIFRLTAWIDKGQWSLNWLFVKQCSTNIGLFYKMILYTHHNYSFYGRCDTLLCDFSSHYVFRTI